MHSPTLTFSAHGAWAARAGLVLKVWAQFRWRASLRPLAACGLLLVLSLAGMQPALADITRLDVYPSDTDARIGLGQPPHLVLYQPGSRPQKLLVWLPGTGGSPSQGPFGFFSEALKHDFRVIGVSYLAGESVSTTCWGRRLEAQPECAGQFRQKRVWGDDVTAVIADKPQDAIVNRLVKLLQYLRTHDASGHWERYLTADQQPQWALMTLAGQSQGGGMAAFMAKTQAVGGVIMFSGGWDQRPGNQIAAWYSRPSQTPLSRWYASYHVLEPMAPTMARIYQTLGIAPEHLGIFDLPVAGRAAHTEGIRNPGYQSWWAQALAGAP